MKMRRIIAAAVSAVALIAVNVGVTESLSAKGTSWGVAGKDSTVTVAAPPSKKGTSWG